MKKPMAGPSDRKIDEKELFSPIDSASESASAFIKAILMRDRKQQKTKLHVIRQNAKNNEETEMAIPETYTEVVGWHAGKEVVCLKKTPEC